MSPAPSARISHADWMDLAAAESRRLGELLSALTPAQAEASTDCAEWTVAEIVAHLSGTAAAAASVSEQLRQQRLASRRRNEGTQLDAVNALQVAERAGLGFDELRQQLAAVTRTALRARRRMPGPIRALRFPFPPPLGWASLGFLNDVVYTRDAWMHRIDICRATGQAVELTRDHDGVIIADAARAWLRLSGGASLALTGPVGLTLGAPDPAAPTFDAVTFARALAGRGNLPGVRPDLVLF